MNNKTFRMDTSTASSTYLCRFCGRNHYFYGKSGSEVYWLHGCEEFVSKYEEIETAQK